MKKITKEMTMQEILELKPEAAQTMMKNGLHCLGCHVSMYETLEQGCLAHGMDGKKINEIVKEINKNNSKNSKKG
ncbi:MAG: DUF1858 domain-containing protein [Candidatus Diapherotrites archaeon]